MSSAAHTLLSHERLHCGVTAPGQYLSGLDLFSGHIGIPVTLVYPQGMQVAHMREALVQTLRHYPLIAGRMKKDGEGQVYVDCNDAGIEFRVHEHDEPLPAHGPDSDFGSQIKRYFKPFYPWQLVDKDMPLLQVNVHRFQGGGVILCCYGPHSLFDGAAYWQFMSDWSRMARGLQVVTPAFDHQVVIEAGQGKGVGDGLVDAPPAPQGLVRDPDMRARLGVMLRLGWQALKMRKGVFRIPAATMQQWKDEAKRALPADAGVSAVELAAAHCLKVTSPLTRSSRARRVGIVLDLRHRRRLRIPRDYFGNALCYGEACYTPQEIEQDSVAVLASKCRPSSEQVSNDTLFSYLGLMEQYRQRRSVWRLFWDSAAGTLDGGLILNNCARFPMYDINFGQGGPAWYDICAVAFRMLMVVPTPEQDGGVDLHFTATKAELKAVAASLAAQVQASASAPAADPTPVSAQAEPSLPIEAYF
ncbi:MAG: acyltransferase [Aquabacterium sp.]